MSGENFGDRLKSLRKERGLYQAQLAEIFKISPSAVGSYERNFREPSYELLKLFALYFNCSTDYLLGYSNEKLSTEEYLNLKSFELEKLIKDYTVTINGKALTDTEKEKLIDVATGLFWDKFSN